jgi:CheY-like chemotaxis protein
MPSRPILIVEDHDDTRAMVATLLASEGYKIAVARNGAEALSVGRAAAPCLILLDLMMPIMSGEEFLLARDSIDVLRGVPVLIMSASPYATAVAARHGGLECLRKPVIIDAVLDSVGRYCRGSSAERTG